MARAARPDTGNGPLVKIKIPPNEKISSVGEWLEKPSRYTATGTDLHVSVTQSLTMTDYPPTPNETFFTLFVII